MLAHVLLLNGFTKTLTYKIPPSLTHVISPGTIVKIPIKTRTTSALVTQIFHEDTHIQTHFALKEIIACEPVPQDPHYHAYIQKLADFYYITPIYFYQRIQKFLLEKNLPKDELSPVLQKTSMGDPTLLTPEQESIVSYVSPYINKPVYTPVLIHGVTGSGKTEVYKQLIIKSIQEHKSIILLFPEVSLCVQFQHLLTQQLPDILFYSFHSATPTSEKKNLWHALLSQTPLVIIGVHLPILLPIATLGIIIIDEEHEQNYTEKKNPHLNSKELALWRAQHYNIPIVLGSATPTLTSLYNTQKNKWRLFSITKRFVGAFPEIKKVILTQQNTFKKRPSFWISHELQQAITQRLNAHEQVIIYLNRRGFSFFVQCSHCGFIFQCPQCSVSLTLHVISQNTPTGTPQKNKRPNSTPLSPQEILRCHYCDYQQELNSTCPDCKNPQALFLKKGIGTQQAVHVLQNLLPNARIARADLDSTVKKRSWHQTVSQFEQGKIDILVGTQSITKGYHFPNVTLIGILWGDLNLNFPLYNAAECALQQLIQVAGRAGRSPKSSLVIIQALRDHPIFDYIHEQKYLEFCQTELITRQELNYPPFTRLVYLELRHNDSIIIDQEAQALIEKLKNAKNQYALPIFILGPAKPIIWRIQNQEIRHIIIKAPTFQSIRLLFSSLKFKYKSMISIIMNNM